MKVIIAGPRDYTPSEQEIDEAVMACGYPVTAVLSGRARGVDQAGEAWAKANGIPLVPFPADWAAHGKGAGPIRNRQMARAGDLLLSIGWDGKKTKGSGSHDMIVAMAQEGKPIFIVPRQKA